jgi:hypothetical protein
MKNLIYSIFIFALLMTGCAGTKKKVTVAPDHKNPSPSTTKPSSGLEVEFDAVGKGNEIHVRIKNNTSAPISVSPYFFALIVNNQKPEIRYNPTIASSKFPRIRVLKGMEVSGVFSFNNYQDIVGQKFVFNSPDYKPLMTHIKAAMPEK